MDPKPFWESRTFWANALVALSAILLLATQQFELSERVLEWLLFASGVTNILLRFVTSQPITTGHADVDAPFR